MEVADIQGAATAATLGAKETVAVAMTEDASFLIMMATNLYSNQKLAPIREVLCNAWDAHIEAGRTDVPIKVTITDEGELIIQDSGLGIPYAKFPSVYGTIGGSTKKLDVKTTGGFGLGAKSPWAYVETFRVTNEHAGVKTVYNLVKASVEEGGKPAIQPVMSVPTERTGITVQFPLKEDDVRTMAHYIRYIAMHGEMLVDFEEPGKEVARLPVLGMSSVPGSYDLESNRWYAHYMGNHNIFVRYGAVIYPMLETTETADITKMLHEFMGIIGIQRLLIQAAPSTLALTPNREALSSSKMTIDGLTDLCVDLVAKMEADIKAQIPQAIKGAIEYLASGKPFTGLNNRANIDDYIVPDSVRRYLNSKLGYAIYQKYKPELDAAEHRGFKLKHVFRNKTATRAYHKLRRQIQNCQWSEREAFKDRFARHFILRPMGKTIFKHSDVLEESKLYTSVFMHGGSMKQRRDHLRFIDLSKEHTEQWLDSPSVFITSRTRRITESMEDCPTVEWPRASWIYKVQPNQKNKAEIIKAFEDEGYHVVDLTLNHDWDTAAQELLEEAARRAAEAAKKTVTLPGIAGKKTPNALLSLSNFFDEKGERNRPHGLIKTMEKTGREMSDTPLFYVEWNAIGRDGGIGMYGNYQLLSDNERQHGVVVRNGIEKNMAIKRGAVPANAYLAPKLWDAFHQPEFSEYRTKHRMRSLELEFSIYPAHLKLLQFLGIKLPGYDKLKTDPVMDRLCELLDSLPNTMFSGHSTNDLQSLSAIRLQKLEEPEFVKSIRRIREDEMMGRLVAWGGLVEQLEKHPDRKAAIKSLVLSAMKGTDTNE